MPIINCRFLVSLNLIFKMAPNPESLVCDSIVIIQQQRPIQKSPSPQDDVAKPKKKSLRLGHLANLVIFAIAEILGGFTFSLLSPFYTQEATNKGLSVTQTGMVRVMAILLSVFVPLRFCLELSLIHI